MIGSDGTGSDGTPIYGASFDQARTFIEWDVKLFSDAMVYEVASSA